jgi:hypothetical protein
MFKIEGTTIKITRGDIGILTVDIDNNDGTKYTFKAGDIVRFKVFKNKDCSCVELQKDIEIESEVAQIDINLTAEDTKIGELISKPVTYWYEVELNPETNPQTVIGYDDVGGAKLFILYPEGGDKE